MRCVSGGFLFCWTVIIWSNKPGLMWTSAKNSAKLLGVKAQTLRLWALQGKIPFSKTPGGQNLYDVEKFKEKLEEEEKRVLATKKEKPGKYIYTRVSSAKQKEDLQRQKQDLGTSYPEHTIISDVGSGINFRRPGLQRLLQLSNQGLVTEIVLAHRDRLCRFAFELLEYVFRLRGTKLVVQSNKDSDSCDLDELSQDLLAVNTVFICRLQGRRAAENRKARKKRSQETGSSPHSLSSHTDLLHRVPKEMSEAMDGML
jgi:putative resolvase